MGRLGREAGGARDLDRGSMGMNTDLDELPETVRTKGKIRFEQEMPD